jgi:4,5-dihydroxyphthalate decarboxylase
VELHYANAEIGTLFLRGEIDAAWGMGHGRAEPGSALARRDDDISGNPEFCWLFADPKAEAIRYYRKTGIFPPHHTTAVRESILQQHPWVARSLMEAFTEAKRLARQRMREQSLFVFGPHYQEEVRSTLGADPFAYGVKANRSAIEMIQTISVEQSLTPRPQPLEELFPEEVLLAEERL